MKFCLKTCYHIRENRILRIARKMQAPDLQSHHGRTACHRHSWNTSSATVVVPIAWSINVESSEVWVPVLISVAISCPPITPCLTEVASQSLIPPSSCARPPRLSKHRFAPHPPILSISSIFQSRKGENKFLEEMLISVRGYQKSIGIHKSSLNKWLLPGITDVDRWFYHEGIYAVFATSRMWRRFSAFSV